MKTRTSTPKATADTIVRSQWNALTLKADSSTWSVLSAK